MIRAALYIRVSTEEQALEGFSLEAQEQRLRAFAKARGQQVVGPYIDDGSGKTTKRPQYQAMLRDIAKWDMILVYKLDRLHRNSQNFMAMTGFLRKKRKGFASLTESIDTSTAVGRFTMDLIARLAQLESDQNGERTLFGMTQKASTTDETLARPCIGMKARGGNFVPDASTVKGIEHAFVRFRSLQNLSATCRELNQKFPRPGKRPWTVSNLRNGLRNVSLIGVKMWAGHMRTFSHEPVVDVDLFMEVQTLLDRQGIVVSPGKKAEAFLRARQVAIEATKDGRRIQLTYPRSQQRDPS